MFFSRRFDSKMMLLGLATFFAFASSAHAGRLMSGANAPKISVDTWVQGDSVSSFQSGKVYVVEFWATWCGPCLQSIPHLNGIQKKYSKDLVVMGIAASESGKEPLERLKSFLKTTKNKPEYRIAFNQSKDMHKDWMEAAEQRGIPTAFIIGKKGTIEWMGHPLAMDKALDSVMAGTWDLAANRKKLDGMCTKIASLLDTDKWAEAVTEIEAAYDFDVDSSDYFYSLYSLAKSLNEKQDQAARSWYKIVSSSKHLPRVLQDSVTRIGKLFK